jgi:PucR C-terminal helix-turn-helix domain/GGDEF-like domain
VTAAVPRPESLPSPRGAHLEMVGAVLAGEGLERIAGIAAKHAGAPVAVIVPRVGAPVEAWGAYERFVASRLAGGRPKRPPEITAEVPIASGGRELGAVLLLGRGRSDAGEYLHVAAVAALTEIAVNEARDETEQNLRGSFLEELLRREDLEADEVVRRGRRLGADFDEGGVALCADPGERAPGRLLAAIAAEWPGAIAQAIDGRVYGLIPGSVEDARRAAARLGRRALVGISSRYSNPNELRRALEEAELMLEVRSAGGEADGDVLEGGTYRLLFRAFASHPEEVKSFYEDTVGPLVRYDTEYSTDLLRTLEAYLGHNCNMNATAHALYAHRHTVSYRLERVRELTGLDPLTSEGRERLSLGLKAYRIIAPKLPR